jgi:hypothetical protein
LDDGGRMLTVFSKLSAQLAIAAATRDLPPATGTWITKHECDDHRRSSSWRTSTCSRRGIPEK